MKSSLKFSNAEKILLGAGFSENEIIPILSNLQNPDTFENTKNKLIISGLDYGQVENLKTFSSALLSSLVSSSDIPMADIINQKNRPKNKNSIIESLDIRESYSEKKLASGHNLGSSGGYSSYSPSYSTTYRKINIPKLILSLFLSLFIGLVIAFIIGTISRYGIYATQYIINLWTPYSTSILVFSIILIIALHFLPLKSGFRKVVIGILLCLDVFFIFGVLPALLIQWFFSSYLYSVHVAITSLSMLSAIFFFIINKKSFAYFIHRSLFFIGALSGALASVLLLL